MLFKQKLKTEQAFQYCGTDKSYQELVSWFRKYSLRNNPPFYWIGRALYVSDLVVMSGDYVVLSADRKRINVIEKLEFEATHSLNSEGKKK